MSNSNLVCYTRLSPNCNSPRNHAIDKITIHHMAGNLSIEDCLLMFSYPEREGSANYVIGSDGRIGLCVDEKNRAWTSGSPENDHRAVTIEVANDKRAPTWHVSDKALQACIDLCVDICKRNGIKSLNWTGDASGNLTIHKFFQATECPGAYLEGKMPWIAGVVSARLAGRIGDVNGDGKINARDVTALMKSLAGKAMVDHVLADVNGDGKVNARDVLALMKMVAKGEIASKPTPKVTFSVGDAVTLKDSATTFTDGKEFAAFLHNMTLYVRAVENDGTILLLSTLKTGNVYTGRFRASDVKKGAQR